MKNERSINWLAVSRIVRTLWEGSARVGVRIILGTLGPGWLGVVGLFFLVTARLAIGR